MATTDQQKADTLNKQYHNVYTKEDENDTPILESRDVKDTLTIMVIQKVEVIKKLKSLKISCTAGPDYINLHILKEIDGLPKHMFQLSINKDTLPID